MVSPEVTLTVSQAEQSAARPVRSVERTEPLFASEAKHELWDALIGANTEKAYIPDRVRQQEIFDRIDWDAFRDELFAGVGDTKTAGAGKQLRGKLLEMLIQADPEFGQRSALEKELLDLAHNPDAYNLGKELGYHRNPDLAFIIVQKENGIVIEGVGESKLGLLNERSFRQLSETGFARGVHALVDVINGLENPAEYGLNEVAQIKAEMPVGTPVLTISPEFSQLLVVPANRDPDRLSTLFNYKDLPKASRQPFRELLTDPNKVVITKAAFSTAEVKALTETSIRSL